jgi:lipopolysaccharide/colanic/teichoic acid biosynthesis glycosyltransferase
VPEESLSIIGSSNKNEPGELYTIAIRYNIAQPRQRRNKRVFDLLLGLLLVATLPLWAIFSGKRRQLGSGLLPVLLGRKSWVGYAPHPDNARLPRLQPGVFTTLDGLDGLHAPPNTVARLNFLYVKDWNVWRDAEILVKVRGKR